ncbi:REP-associated tyrosine transposase [Gracilimonas sp.]|uniref:REP-associated tyrosine transposase n=1 Tax=Gracilimonas sp. TaxID=1974203 RepID=UPI002870CFE8|nr:transposase [Gracilimonas sp.]
MGRSRYKILDESYPYFITSSIVGGYSLFKEKRFINVIIDGLNFLSRERNISIYAYVIMPNHLHFISQGRNLSKYVSSFKSFAARQSIDKLKEEENEFWLDRLKEARVNTKIDREYQLWTEGFHPKQIFSSKVMEQKINYIHYNPVTAGLVEKESDWLYSSYGDYYGNSTRFVDIERYRG